MPNREVFDKNTNQKITEDVVVLSLYLDDKAAPSVFPYLENILPNRVSLNKRNHDTINIMVPEDKFGIFANPNGKLMGKILSIIEQNVGYVADVNSLSSLQSRLQLVKDEIKNSDSNAVATVTNQYIRDLVAGMAKDYNDPRFQQIMNSIHVFSNGGFAQQGNTYNDSDVLFKETKLTVENILRILAQWNKAGRSGIPTYLATANQWDRYFGGKVRQDALKLYIMRPNDGVAAVSKKTVARQLNIDPSNAYASGAKGKAIGSLSRGGGMDNWRKKADKYAPVCYYDISDVDNVDPNSLTGNSSNYYDPNTVTADTVDADAVIDPNADSTNNNDIVNDTPVMTEDIMRKKLLKLSSDTNNNGIRLAIQRDGTIGGLIYLISNSKEILRDHDVTRKQATIEQVLFIILRHYHIFENEMINLWKKHITKLVKSDKSVNEQLIVEMWSFAYNIISLLEGIKESGGCSLTLADVIGYLGLTIEDFKKLPKTQEEAMLNRQHVRENFIKTFNNLLITH